MRYQVYLNKTVGTVVEVEADNEDDAIDLAIENVPGSLMFTDHTYPDEGDWEAVEVTVDGQQ